MQELLAVTETTIDVTQLKSEQIRRTKKKTLKQAKQQAHANRGRNTSMYTYLQGNKQKALVP